GLIGGSATGLATGTQLCIALAALIGMGTKAGIMPLHVWLPRAHPTAPAPVSALMSGVMIKIAIYALIRVLVEWVGILPTWFGILVLATGALSALGGVIYAIFQHELKRLLALHSIENIGIIVLGLGACLILRAEGAPALAGFALAAALLHTLNHAVFKALLFLGAGSFERAVGTLHLDRLGGLLRRMPWTGAAFLVGAMAIAGLPPLNGFASEWTTMQSLLRVTLTSADRAGASAATAGAAGAIALAALASTAALALLCFVKVVGLVLLGPARYREDTRPAPVGEAAGPMVIATGFLALACFVLGLAPGPVFRALTRLTDPTLAVDPADTVVLDLPGTGGFPSVGLAALLLAVTAGFMLLRGRQTAAPAPNWACGQTVEPSLNWTSAGFSKPLRLVLRPVLRSRHEVTAREDGGVLREVSYRGRVPQLIDDHLYRPLARWSVTAAVQARRLQSGSLSRYATYLIGLIVVLLGAARIGVLG
ncbi:MAG: hypothetical protein JXA67_04795, partial [Micromonosporaceae bacterium]|nr:hypothetical protein [Micromonosporaceae bacterium]